jgi:chromosome partitioning protein
MIISVTSLKGGVGKSTVAQNLAVNFAHMKYKVLLIDTDANGSSVRRSGLRTAGLPAVQVIGLPDAEALKKNLP